jgi:hypothetical protein
METKKATITREKEKAILVLVGLSNNHEIILTEDNPNNIKLVFNNLINDLKKGIFQFVNTFKYFFTTLSSMFNNIIFINIRFTIKYRSRFNDVYKWC